MTRIQLDFFTNIVDYEAETVRCLFRPPRHPESQVQWLDLFFVRYVEPVFIHRSTTSFVPDSSAETIDELRSPEVNVT